jgi:hypothetical protein
MGAQEYRCFTSDSASTSILFLTHEGLSLNNSLCQEKNIVILAASGRVAIFPRVVMAGLGYNPTPDQGNVKVFGTPVRGASIIPNEAAE